MSARKNPFPGMNPYFEQHWSGVHISLIVSICDALSSELPDDLSARAEERTCVSAVEFTENDRADAAIAETRKHRFPPVWTPPGAGTQAVNVAEPIVFLGESFTERWIEIRDGRGTLITIIEVLSPTNKLPGDGREM